MPTSPKGTGRASSAPAQSAGRVRNPQDSRPSGAKNDSPRTQKKRPGDLTGMRKQAQDTQRDEETGAKAAEAALQAAEDQARNLDEVIDYTADDGDQDAEAQDLTPQGLGFSVSLPVEESSYVATDEEDLWSAELIPEPRINSVQAAVDVQKRKVIIRVNSKIEDMVFGREVLDEGVFDREHPENNREPLLGNLRFYNFDEGHKYKVPIDLALHLEEKGYLYHLVDYGCYIN